MKIWALVFLVFVSGCGFQPVYSGGPAGAVGSALSSVDVVPIPDRIGMLVRERLQRTMGEPSSATHRLAIELKQETEGFGIRGDESVTRERLTLTASYKLIDLASNKSVIEGTARSDAGVDVVRSDYANVVAEETAFERNAAAVADQIRNRLALYFAQKK
jgi:LPS-assembly lipoprotein